MSPRSEGLKSAARETAGAGEGAENGDPRVRPVGEQAAVAALENSTDVPQNMRNGNTV